MLTTAMTAIPLVLSARERIHDTIQEINQKCGEMQLPPAFEVGKVNEASNLSDIYFHGNLDYRFEGFGIVFEGFMKPRLSFWVHYKKGTPEGKEIGRFLISLKLLEELSFNFLPLQKAEAVVERAAEIVDTTQIL